MSGKYDDIIKLPHHTSARHPRMSMHQRAAQFAPFAALTGHGAAISETARLTDQQVELSEYERGILDMKVNLLLEHINEHPSVSVTYFIPDQHKAGGQYAIFSAPVKKWDSYEQILTFDDNTKICLNSIIDIEGELFEK